MKNRFIAGDHNCISDMSGQKFKRSEMVHNWKGQLVHALTEYEPKHPQLTIRPRKEQISVTDGTRTQGADSALQDPPITLAQMI
jgi:hypothetical protein